MRMLRDKRGDIQRANFTIIDLVLLVLILVGFMAFVIQVSNSTLFEKNYLARDLALTLDAVYASPGKIHYKYSGDASRFIVTFENNRVGVRTEDENLPNEYWYADAGEDELTKELTHPEDILMIGIDGQAIVREHVIE